MGGKLTLAVKFRLQLRRAKLAHPNVWVKSRKIKSAELFEFKFQFCWLVHHSFMYAKSCAPNLSLTRWFDDDDIVRGITRLRVGLRQICFHSLGINVIEFIMLPFRGLLSLHWLCLCYSYASGSVVNLHTAEREWGFWQPTRRCLFSKIRDSWHLLTMPFHRSAAACSTAYEHRTNYSKMFSFCGRSWRERDRQMKNEDTQREFGSFCHMQWTCVSHATVKL